MLTPLHQRTKAVQKCIVFVCLFFCNPLFSHSFFASSNFTHIYSDASGTSLFYNARTEGEFSFPHFSAGLNASYSHIYSSLKNITANAHLFDAGVFTRTQFVDFNANVFFLNAQNLLLHIDKDYAIEKATVFGMSFLLPIKLPLFSITPLFSFGNMKSENGNMHYFYSEPEAPFFYATGAKFEIEQLKIAAFYASADMDFYADEQNGSEKLINSDIWAAGIFSNYEFLVKKCSIVPSLGFFHLDAQAKGALTAQNQMYLFFPYTIFNLAGSAKIDALIFGAHFIFKKQFFSIFTDFTALLCVHQTGSYKAHYLYKKNIFFDGSQGTYEGKFEGLQGNGLGFLTVSADFTIPIKNARIVLSPKKIFLIPLFFNLKDINKSSGSNSVQLGGAANNFVLYYLLSGLSFTATVQYN